MKNTSKSTAKRITQRVTKNITKAAKRSKADLAASCSPAPEVHDYTEELRQADEAQFAADLDTIAAEEKAAVPEQAAAPVMMLDETITEAMEVRSLIHSEKVVAAVNEAITKFGCAVVVPSLQGSLRSLGERMIIDRRSQKIGKWTCSRVNRVDPDVLLDTFTARLVEEAAAAEAAKAQPQPQAAQA